MGISALLGIKKQLKSLKIFSPANPVRVHILEDADPNVEFFIRHYTPIENGWLDADILVYPRLIRDSEDIPATLKTITKKYREYKRPVLVFILSDFEGEYPYYKNLRLLRTSARQSKLRDNEFILPYVWESSGEPFTECETSSDPLIGFCGLISAHRETLIQSTVANNRLECRFILRDKFWGGQPHDPLLMKEFWDNMRNCQFMLADRGVGNFSMRFYQALSMGRIPVLLNTDMEFPLSSYIDWNNLIVLGKTASECVEQIMKIHESGQTKGRQQKCYEIYHQFLSEKKFLFNLLPAIMKW